MVLTYVAERAEPVTIPGLALALDVVGSGYEFDAVERAVVELVRSRILCCEGAFLRSACPCGPVAK